MKTGEFGQLGVPKLVVRYVTEDHVECFRGWYRHGLTRSYRVGEPHGQGKGQLVLFSAPPPFTSLIAICFERDRELRPVIIFKNLVPFYAMERVTSGQIDQERWHEYKDLVLLYNPGLKGALLRIENESFGGERMS